MKSNSMNSIPNSNEIDLLEVFGIFYSGKLIIFGTTIIAAVGVVVFSIISLILPPEKSPLPNVYKPGALLWINEQSGGGIAASLASSGLGGLAGLANISIGGYGDLAVKLLQSKTILDRVIEEFDLIKRYKIIKSPIGATRLALLNKASFSYDTLTSTLSISYTDKDPEFATQIVNRFVDLLDKRFLSIGGNKNITRKNLLETKLIEVEASIVKLELEIEEFQKKYGVLSVEALATEQVTMVAEIRSKLILKEMEIKTYSDFARIEDPVLSRLKAERDNLLQLLNQMESGFSQFKGVITAQQDIPKLIFEFGRLERDLKVQAKIFEILTQQYEVAKFSVEGEGPVFQVLELAEVPDMKDGPSRAVLCIITTCVAFILSIVFVLVRHTVRKIRNDPEAMKKIAGPR